MRPWRVKQSILKIPSKSVTSLWLAYLIVAIGIIISLLCWYTFVSQTNANLQSMVTLQTQRLANDPNNQFVLRISALKQLAKHLNAPSNADNKNSLEDIKYLLTESPEYGLLKQLNLQLAATKHYSALPFILGMFIAILFAISCRLAYLTRISTRALAQIHEDLQKENKERLQAEATKQRLERALLQGQKLQAIGTLAGGIAHDFNNILYAIIGYVEMAQEDVPADSLIHKNLSRVLEGSKRGQELVSRILTFSRRQVYEFKKMCLKDTVKSVLSFIRPAIPASINMSFSFDLTNSYIILGNQTQLHQIIMNIINNAVDSMDGDGSIFLSLSKADPDDPFLKQLPETKGSGYCKLEITDQGHGMDEHTIERIFEPFFTTKEVGKGTGLGLATAHAIAKEHQGDIMVTSQLGLGSTFTLYLPLLDKELTDGQNSTR